MTISLDAALLDVRKAYRLLADYQQRIVELLGFIRGEFDAIPYHHCWRNMASRDFQILERNDDSGSRLLPLLDASALWIRHSGDHEDYVHQHSKGDLLIDVQICSDTGFSTKSNAVMQPVEVSRSELAISLIRCDEPAAGPFNWYDRVWNRMPYPEHGKLVTTEKVPGYRMYREFVPLTAFTDEQATRTALTQFRRRAGEIFGHEV
ncbi:hypothetical protein AB4Z48_03045 [Cupriavidus sp. 2TAF22]|uniref:hypothetical protein n=1 Tax=unclassified Cupriavidus TaxID=2640874 RepID=UPI003F938054